VRIKKSSLLFLAVSVLVVLVGVYFLSTHTLSIVPRASNSVRTVTGVVIKNSGSVGCFNSNHQIVSAYGLRASSIGAAVGDCLPLVVSSALADPLLNKRVQATGVLNSGVFYATSLVLASNLETMPGVKPRKFTPAPTVAPTVAPTPCVGLVAKSACDPKAISNSQKCCAPLVCQGRWNNKTGKYENYSCQRAGFGIQ